MMYRFIGVPMGIYRCINVPMPVRKSDSVRLSPSKSTESCSCVPDELELTADNWP